MECGGKRSHEDSFLEALLAFGLIIFALPGQKWAKLFSEKIAVEFIMRHIKSTNTN